MLVNAQIVLTVGFALKAPVTLETLQYHAQKDISVQQAQPPLVQEVLSATKIFFQTLLTVLTVQQAVFVLPLQLILSYVVLEATAAKGLQVELIVQQEHTVLTKVLLTQKIVSLVLKDIHAQLELKFLQNAHQETTQVLKSNLHVLHAQQGITVH